MSQDFNSEWVTIAGPKHEHRVLLRCRDGFPGRDERVFGQIAVETVDRCGSGMARVVHVFFDDKHCTHTIYVASTDPKDEMVASSVTQALQAVDGSGNPSAEYFLVKKGNESSDHYVHMAHLSESFFKDR